MFSRVFRLLTEDCDVNKNLRLSRLFQFLQEISIADTERLGYPREKTLDKGLLWVVGKQRVEIKRLPVYGEEIRLETWPGEKTPFLFPRHYAIYGNNEEPLVKRRLDADLRTKPDDGESQRPRHRHRRGGPGRRDPFPIPHEEFPSPWKGDAKSLMERLRSQWAHEQHGLSG